MKLVKLLPWAVLALLAIVVFTVSFWLLYPYRTMEFKDPLFRVLNENKTVERGGRLKYEVNACKYTDIVPTLKKFFVDGVIYEVTESYGAVDKGCGKTIVDVYVPRAIPVGNYKMKFIAKYQVNPIREIVFVNYSEAFVVK